MQIDPSALELVRHEFEQHALGEALRLIAAERVQLFGSEESGTRRISRYTVISGTELEDAIIVEHRNGDIDVECSCGRPRCAHLAAALLLRRSTPAEQPASTWRRELSQALPPLETAQEYCLFVTLVQPKPSRYAYAPRADPYLGARPGMMGARGAWIKGQASWQKLAYERRQSRQTAALHRLHRLWGMSSDAWYQDPDWLRLAELPGRELWSALADVRDAGVPLVSPGKAQHPVVFDDQPVDTAVTIERHGDSLRLGARASRPTRDTADAQVLWLGDPIGVLAQVTAAGAAAEQIRLVRLDAPLARITQHLLERTDPIVIPADEVEAFETEFLPRIQTGTRVVSPDDSYSLPDPPHVSLVLTLQFASSQLHLSWTWDRPGAVGDPTEEAALTASVNAVLDPLPALSGTGRPGIPLDRTLGTAATVTFVTELLPRLRELEGLTIVEHSELPDYRAADGTAVVRAEAEPSGDWFDLHFTVTIDGEEVDFAELFTALSLDEPIFVLPSGIYFPLDGDEFAKLREIIDEARALGDRPSATAEGIRLNRNQLDIWNDLSELGALAAREAEWWLAVQSLADGEGVVPVAPPAGLRAQLRDYQLAGFSWLHFLRTHGLGGLLADDMGLGKTLQSIAMIEAAREENPSMSPFLIVAPTSVVSNWASECARFAPELRVTTIGSMTSRRGMSLAEAVSGAHVVLTSYALFRGEADQYRELEWSGLIVDEAQKIKNSASHGYRAARDLGAPFCLVLTGTPLENNLGELWALASLAAPGLLGTLKKFTEFYRTPIEKQRDADRLGLLQRRLRPFLMRRTKELVASELPEKQEQVLEIELHPKHRRLYDVRFQRERQKVLGLVDDVEANRFQIFRSLALLRQLALDPALIDEGEAPSAKLEALEELIVEAAEEGHRVLVLSQFTRFLTAARDRVAAAGIASQYLDGNTRDRARVIAAFREGSDPAFFVSLHAGGFGLNLVEADYVVLLDPWWNPAVEEQAIDRAHRIGQTRPVIVYRLVARNTIEQKVIALRESKAELFSRVLDGEGEFTPGGLTAEDVRGLLE